MRARARSIDPDDMSNEELIAVINDLADVAAMEALCANQWRTWELRERLARGIQGREDEGA